MDNDKNNEPPRNRATRYQIFREKNLSLERKFSILRRYIYRLLGMLPFRNAAELRGIKPVLSNKGKYRRCIVHAGAVLYTAFLSVFVFSCSPYTKISAIKKADVLKIGVKTDVPGLSFYNKQTESFEGLEIELGKLFAEELLGDASKVKFIPVTAMTRGPLVDGGDLDMAIATFSITEERKLRYHFTNPYYVDTFDMLVKKDSGYTSLKELDGKKIGISMSTTAGDIIENAAEKEEDCQPILVEFETYAAIKQALDEGEIDVMAADTSILKGYLDENTVIFNEALSRQSYGVATKRTDREFAAFVDGCIQRWLADGTISRLTSSYHL